MLHSINYSYSRSSHRWSLLWRFHFHFSFEPHSSGRQFAISNAVAPGHLRLLFRLSHKWAAIQRPKYTGTPSAPSRTTTLWSTMMSSPYISIELRFDAFRRFYHKAHHLDRNGSNGCVSRVCCLDVSVDSLSAILCVHPRRTSPS